MNCLVAAMDACGGFVLSDSEMTWQAGCILDVAISAAMSDEAAL